MPGVVGRIGTLLGDARVNIAEIHLAREPSRDIAIAVLRLDEEPSEDVLEALADLREVNSVQLVNLG